ncbi:hypothetical protein EPO33_01940 [Patescibacteria group bacterium]|nr:MAG: hypothetical protein EPO33_01940 [Patescibacteria group bacterium]
MNEERIIRELVEIKEIVSDLRPLRQEFNEFRDFVTTTLDLHTGMLQRLDQERLSQHIRSDRIEVRVDRLEKHTGLV